MGIKTLIIEDEAQAISALKAEIAAHCPEIEILGTAGSISEGVDKIRILQPQLIFLDIQLSDGLGFEILNSYKDHDFRIIFTTAYSQYAIKAIRFSALDYLLKPIDSQELIDAVQKAAKSSKSLEIGKMENFIQNRHEDPIRKKVAFQTSEGISIFEISTIIRCSSESNYTGVYFDNGKKILFSKTLKEFEDLLCSNGFERIHHSHLINLNHMTQFVNKDGGYVVLSDRSTLPVSQRKKAALLEVLKTLKF